MTIAPVAHTNFTGAAGGGTTPTGIDTTGANAIFIVSYSYQGTGSGPLNNPTDNKGNTYTQRAILKTSPTGFQIELWECISPTVGTGHTFTRTGSNIYASFDVLAVSGLATTSFFGGSVTATIASGAGTAQAGSVTPTSNGSLVLSAYLFSDGMTGTASIDSGFTITDQQPAGTGTTEGGALAYLIQGTAGAVNPTWTATAGTQQKAALNAWYLPAAGGGGNVSVSISGLAMTGGQGAVPLTAAVAPSGLAMTSGRGALSPTAAFTPSGLAMTAGQGALSQSASISVLGQGMTAGQGAFGGATTIGLGAAFDAGGFDPGSFYETNMQMVAGIGAITVAVSVSLGGQAMTASRGQLSLGVSANLAGMALTASRGNLALSASVGLVGLGLASANGFLVGFNKSATLIGLQASMGQGAITPLITPFKNQFLTLDTIIVPYEERAIELLPEETVLGIPSEQLVLYVSPDSGAEGETH